MKPDLLAAAGRRRPGRRGDVAAGPQGAGPLAAPSTEGSSADLLGQQVVREVLSGAGLGALSPVLAAEMVLQAGGIDSGVLETDSNRQMQAVMNTMGGLTGQDPAGCVQGVMGGMPQVAQQAMQRGMGGMPSFLPGQQQPQQGPPDPAQDLGALFQQLSQIGEGDLDAMLNQVGGQLIQSLGPEGMQELLGAMGVLLDDEQLGQGLQALVPEQVQDLMRQAMPGAEPQQQEKPTEEGAEQVPEEEGEAGQQATVETQEEGASSGAAPAEGQQQQAPGGPGAQQASEQGGGGGGAGGGQGEAPAAEMAPSTAPTETAPQQAPSPVTTQQPPTAPSGPPRRQEPVSPPPAQQPSTQVQSPPPPPAMPPASGGGGGSYDVAPPTGEAAQTEEEGPSEHNIDLQMNLDLPPELQGGGGAEAPEHECDVSTPDVQANVGEGMVPQSDYTANEAQPGGMSGGPSGDAMTDSGVDPAAGAAGVAVQPSAGTEAGSGTPGGGEAAAPEVQEGLNPAANQELAQQPEHTAPTPTAPGSPPDMEAIEAEGGGGGGDLPSANIEGVSYSAGDEHLPNPDAPDVPADFASGGTSQAESQMTQDAAQMDSVQPAVDGQVASEVAPQEEEGNQGILDAIRSFFESLGLFDSQASSTETQAQSQQQQAQASTQALIADAQAQQQAQLAQQSGLPVPAELSQRGETYMQAVTEAEANATAVWAGGPQMQMPSGAQTAMDTASADVSQLQGGAVQPDLAGTVGAVQLPDHGLQPQGFSEVVPAGQQQLDPSAIPQQISPFPGSSGGGGGEAMDQIQADVDSQVASEIEAYQQQVLQEQTDRATQGYDGMMAGTEACYQGSVDNAHSAIAEYDAVDIAGEVAPFDAQAQAAFGDAQSQADAAMSTMDSTFATEQGAFDGALADAQGTFQGSVTDAQGQHGSAVDQAGGAYDQAVGQAQQELQTGHNEALGTYQNQTTAAQQGAQQTFDAEHQLAQQAVTEHRAGFDSQYQGYQSSADQVGGQAESLFQSEFSAQQARLDSQTQQAISQTQGRIDSEMTSGQSEIDQLLSQGQADAQAELDAGLQQAQSERDSAQGEADRKLAEAENQDRNIFQKIGDAIASAISAALDWIKARFEEAKNAIVGFLEAARDAALSLLEAARDAALAVLDRVRGLIQGLIDVLADVLRTFISAVAAFLQTLIQFVIDWILAQIQAITALITGLIEAFQAVVNAVVEGLIAAVALIDADLAARLEEAASGFLDTFNSLCDNAQASIESASQALQDQIQAAGDALQSAVAAAEETLISAVDTAEAALHAGVDAAYNAAVTAVNTAYEVATDVVNATFDLARDAVVFVIDAAYSVIEAAATELAEHIQEVFHAIGEVAEWVTQNIVGPVLDFLADPWAGLRQMWVSFWNSPWRDVLLGVALAALATVVCVATGGLGLVAMIAITAAVTGAAAAVTYGAGEMAARRANVSLVQEGHQTWEGASMIDPATGEMVPDPRDPQNAWYLDTLGSISSNPDGSMSYVGPDGELVTLTPDQLANDPSAVLAMMEYGLERGEDGTLSGESMGDSLRGSAAIAADKGIEWTINGAVTAATMGMGNSLTAAREAGRIGTVAMNTMRIGGGAAMSATGDLISAPVSDAVGEMISDGRDFDEAFDMAWQYEDVGDVATAWGTSFVTNAVGDAIGDGMGGIGRNDAGTGWADTSFLGRTGMDAATGVATSTSGMVLQNASDVMFDGDPETGWNEFWERSTSADAMDQIIQGTVEGVISSRADEFAESYGESLRPGIDRRFGSEGTQSLDQAVQDHASDLEDAGIQLDDQGRPTVATETDTPAGDQTPAPAPPPPQQQQQQPAMVDGNASRISQDSDFHGANSSEDLNFSGLYNGIRRMRTNLGEGDGLTFETHRDEGHYQANVQVQGRDVPVRIEIADMSNADTQARFTTNEHGTDAARLRRNDDGTWTVELSGNLSEADVSRALAHELSEIRFIEGTGGTQDSTQAGILTRDGLPTEQMTGHDAGRVAELADMIAELDRHRPEEGQTSDRYDQLQREIAIVMRETGLDQNNTAGRERLRVLADNRDLLPPAALDRLTTHMADQLSVDIGGIQQRVGDMSAALFTSLDYVDGRKVLDALSGMNEHEARAFYDVVREELNLTPDQLHAQMTSRLQAGDRSEALAHLSGDRLQSTEAALQNLLDHEDFERQASQDASGAESEGPGRFLRSLLNVGSWTKEKISGNGANRERALQLLGNLDPTQRSQLIQRNPDLLGQLGEQLSGNDRARWDALTAPQQEGQDARQWNDQARAADLMIQIRQDLRIGDSWLTRTLGSRDRDAALRNLDRLTADPRLYEAALQQVARDLPEGSDVTPADALSQMVTEGLGGRWTDRDRSEHEIAQVQTRLDRAALEVQHQQLTQFLSDVGLSTNSADLQLLAARASDNDALRQQLHEAIGVRRTDELIQYTAEQRRLQIQDQAHQVLAAIDSGHYQEVVGLLRDPSGAELQSMLESGTMNPQERQLAEWMLGRWNQDRAQLREQLNQLTDNQLDSLLGDLGNARQRELIPDLVDSGVLPRDGQLSLALGRAKDASMVADALRGLGPHQIADVARQFRDRAAANGDHRRLLGQHDDPVQFLQAVLRDRLSGRGEHEALLALMGDGQAVYDPRRDYGSDEVRTERAGDRYQLELDRLQQSHDYETQNGGAADWLQGGQPSTQRRLDQGHDQLQRFLDANADALRSGDPGTWATFEALRGTYDRAVRDHQSARSSASKRVSGWAKTGVGLAAGIGIGVLTGGASLPFQIAGKIGAGFLGTGTGVATRYGMDRTQSSHDVQRDLLSGVAGNLVGGGMGALDIGQSLTDTAVEKMAGGLASGTASSVTKRGMDYYRDGSDNRREMLARGLTLDLIKSSFGAGLSTGTGLVTGGDAFGSSPLGTGLAGTKIDDILATPIKNSTGDGVSSSIDAVADRHGDRRAVRDGQSAASDDGLAATDLIGDDSALDEVRRNRRRLNEQRRRQRGGS